MYMNEEKVESFIWVISCNIKHLYKFVVRLVNFESTKIC